MNFNNALLLVTAIFGITELVKALVPSVKANSRLTVLVVLIVGIAATQLVAHTAWANEQVIGDKPLDTLNLASQILVGLLAAGAASFGDRFLLAVRNIGENQTNATPTKAAAKRVAAK